MKQEQILIDMQKEAKQALERLNPQLDTAFAKISNYNPEDRLIFQYRLNNHFAPLFSILLNLYGNRYDFFYHLQSLITIISDAWVNRPKNLKSLDKLRETNPTWYQNHTMVGAVAYVDLFAGNLEGIRKKIPYFKELGLTYLHLMPLFLAPESENDGGYAISSYREIDPNLGTMDDLRELADELRQEGISLVLDFVFNHTSNEHEWAKRARSGDETYKKYYRLYPDRTLPDAYEQHLREIFPDEHPGAFTYFEDIHHWVWTTFHSNQWDLNYANPEVFNQMAAEMLFLANQGAEVLRLDAVAFIWKELGTVCENLPQAHLIIQAYNAIAWIAAPALLFKSEAIVHPDAVARYIKYEECQLSYNPLLMALLWHTLATREVDLLQVAMEKRFQIPEKCTWVNYVRCHDDIGWTFSDEDAAALGINAFDHRQFLNAYYTSNFEGSFARGLPFQQNLKTKDARISGTCASLAGLEKALHEETSVEVALAIRRILLIHNVIMTIGGIPLIYLGDEIGMLNDYDYKKDPTKKDDSRWVHRLPADLQQYSDRNYKETVPGQIFEGISRLIQLRKTTPAIGGEPPEFIRIGNQRVFAYLRHQGKSKILFLNNFSDNPQVVNAHHLEIMGTGLLLQDQFNGGEYLSSQDLSLEPFQFMWLEVRPTASE